MLPWSPAQGAQSQQKSNQQNSQMQTQQNSENVNAPPINLATVLHFLQTEWRRHERERNEWEIERSEMRARIALLEGERRGNENLKTDLLRRVKMLEFALRQERQKYLNSTGQIQQQQQQQQQQSASSQRDNNKDAGKDKPSAIKSDLEKVTGSTSDGPKSDENPPSPEPQQTGQQKNSNNTSLENSNNNNSSSGSLGAASTGPPAWNPSLGRDPRARAKSRAYLKQCLQEINYLTSPTTMNPLAETTANGIVRPPRKQMVEINAPVAQMQQRSATAPGASRNDPVPRSSTAPPPLSAPPPPNGIQQQQQQQQSSEIPTVSSQPSNSESYPSTTENSSSSTSSSTISTPAPNVPTIVTDYVSQQASQSTPQETTPIHTNAPSEPITQQEATEQSNPTENTPDSEKEQDTSNESEQPDTKSSPSDDTTPSSSNISSSSTANTNSSTATSSTEDEILEGSKLWKIQKTLSNHLDSVRCLSFERSDSDLVSLVSAGDDNTIKLWRLAGSTLSSSETRPGSLSEPEPQMTLRGHSSTITSLAVSSAKKRLYSASMDQTVQVWSLPPRDRGPQAPFDSSTNLASFEGHTDAVWDLALHPYNAVLATASSDGTCKLWSTDELSSPLKLSWSYNGSDSETENEPREPSSQPIPTSLTFCQSDLRKLAISYNNSIVKLFDIETGKEMLKLKSDETYDGTSSTQINYVVTHPSLPLLMTAHEDKYIRIFDLNTGQCSHTILAHNDAVTSIDVDPAGLTLVSAGHDCSVKIWDILQTRKCLQEISDAHQSKSKEGVLDVRYHPTLPILASSGADGLIKLYGA